MTVRDSGSAKSGPGAIPVSDIAMYSINSGLTGSAEILKGSLSFIQNIPVSEKEKGELKGQIVLMSKKIDDMKADLGKRIGRVERSWEDLVPKIILEYYEASGYEARETDVRVDQKFKIDVIAVKNDEVRATQVKKGQIAPEEIIEIARKASGYIASLYPDCNIRIVSIFASSLPEDFLEIRDMLKNEEIDLTYVLPNHVTRKLPKYRYVFFE